MKKTILVVALLALCAVASKTYAQDNPYSSGNFLIQATVGLPYVWSDLLVPPVGLSGEYGIVDFGRAGTLGAGGLFEYANYHSHWIQASAFAGYHFFINEAFEVHAKAGLGYRRYYDLSGVGALFLAGASYFFTPHFAVTAEAGYTHLSYLRLGVTFLF
ncbi:MAG: hypothetical protein IJQ69_02155 [Bacteroidales bacterium]|nr:hypothetical protein [Bacteroidales bacterium]